MAVVDMSCDLGESYGNFTFTAKFKIVDGQEEEMAGLAFRIQDEAGKLRESYGMTQIGQCALLGRRLVEAGCRFVGIDAPGWDVHFNCFPSLKEDLIPPADRASLSR